MQMHAFVETHGIIQLIPMHFTMWIFYFKGQDKSVNTGPLVNDGHAEGLRGKYPIVCNLF